MNKLLKKKLKNCSVIEIKNRFCIRLNPKTGKKVACDGKEVLPDGMYLHFLSGGKHYVQRVKLPKYDAQFIYSAPKEWPREVGYRMSGVKIPNNEQTI